MSNHHYRSHIHNTILFYLSISILIELLFCISFSTTTLQLNLVFILQVKKKLANSSKQLCRHKNIVFIKNNIRYSCITVTSFNALLLSVVLLKTSLVLRLVLLSYPFGLCLGLRLRGLLFYLMSGLEHRDVNCLCIV